MNLRKIFNIPNAHKKALIKVDYENLETYATSLADKHNAEQRKYQESHDCKCPHCGGTDIVNKITRVQGEGYVSGDLFGISGRSSTDTNEANHCSNCGNQWKKYNRTYKGDSYFIKEMLNDISTHLEGKYDYADREVKKYQEQGFYAETLYKALKKSSYSSDLYLRTKNMSLNSLRKIFKSVYR